MKTKLEKKAYYHRTTKETRNKILMINGDNQVVVARNIAKKLGINEFRTNLLPEDKIKIINELMDNHNNHVIMVENGINDALH